MEQSAAANSPTTCNRIKTFMQYLKSIENNFLITFIIYFLMKFLGHFFIAFVFYSAFFFANYIFSFSLLLKDSATNINRFQTTAITKF